VSKFAAAKIESHKFCGLAEIAEGVMDRQLSLKIMALLAFVQALAGLLRAFNWVQVGVNLFGQGLLLLPFVGAVAVMRGLFISVVALLYVLFAIGALLGKSWSRWLGLTAAIINLLLVVSALAQGAGLIETIAWSAIPVILVIYLFSQTGRKALKGA
jgi:uncharacterized membrane protein (DUF2068 family)